MRTTLLFFIAALCSAGHAAAAVTVLSASRGIAAVAASHQCSDGFGGATGQTLVSTNTDTGLFNQSVLPVSSASSWGQGSAGQNSLVSSAGISMPSLWAAVNSPLVGGCILSSSAGRSANASISVTFQLDEPTAYVFTGSLIQAAFSSGFSGSRSYSLNLQSVGGFDASFINGENVAGGGPNVPGPDTPRSFSREGILPAGTYTFSASLSVRPEAPPSYSSSTDYQMSANLQFIPEPGGTALLMMVLGAASGVRRRARPGTGPDGLTDFDTTARTGNGAGLFRLDMRGRNVSHAFHASIPRLSQRKEGEHRRTVLLRTRDETANIEGELLLVGPSKGITGREKIR